MRKKAPEIYNFLKLPGEITNIIRIEETIAVILNDTFFLTAPFDTDRGVGGLFHTQYTHKHPISSICKVKMKSSFSQTIFSGSGSYDPSNSIETFWLFVDELNTFSLFSLRMKCILLSFNGKSITHNTITSICGLNHECFAVMESNHVYACRISNQGCETIFCYDIASTMIKSFNEGFLALRNEHIDYCVNGKIYTYFDSEMINDFFIMNSQQTVVVQRLGKNCIFHIVKGNSIGIKHCKAYDIYDDWVVSLVNKNQLIIVNIQDSSKRMKITLPILKQYAIKTFRRLYAGYNNAFNSITVLLSGPTDIIFLSVPLILMTEIYKEEEEEEEEEEEDQSI